MFALFITEIKRCIKRRRELQSERPEKRRFGWKAVASVAALAVLATAGYMSTLDSMSVGSEPGSAVVPTGFDTNSGAHFRNVKMVNGEALSSETIRMLLYDGCAVVSSDMSYLNDFLPLYSYAVVATAEESGESVVIWCDTSSDGLPAASKQVALEGEYSALLIKIDEKVHAKEDAILKTMHEKFEAWWTDLSLKGFEDTLRVIFGGEQPKVQFLKEFKSTQDVSKCTDDLALSFASEQFANGKLIKREQGSATQWSKICQTKLNIDVGKQKSGLTAAFIRVRNAEAVLAE